MGRNTEKINRSKLSEDYPEAIFVAYILTNTCRLDITKCNTWLYVHCAKDN